MASMIPKDVQDAFYRVTHDFGVEKLATRMGMSPGVLYNKANCNDGSHHKPTLADGIVVTHLTGDVRIAQAFSHSVGGVHVMLPNMADLSTDALLVHLLKMAREAGNFHGEIHAALADDNRISGKELVRIEAEAQVWISAILEGLARMKEMAR